MNQIWENGEKTNFGYNFGPSGSNVDPQFFCIEFTSTSSWTLFQAIILCNFTEN